MPARTLPIRRWLIASLGGLDNDLIGRRTHLGAAAVIFDRNGRVLLVPHTSGPRGWELPGGGRRPKEPLEQAGFREVGEELGVEALSDELRASYYEPAHESHPRAFL